MINQYGTIIGETLLGTSEGDTLYGGGADMLYTSALDTLANAGVGIAAYVYSGYGTRPLSEVKHDIDFLSTIYPQMSYLFIDETSSQSADLNHYYAIADYAHALGLQVIFNCGILPENNGYFTASDIVVVTENSINGVSYVTEAHTMGIDSAQIASLGYSVDAANVIEQTQSYFDAGAGYTYVTEDGKNGTNPWDTLSSSFLDEIAVATQYGGKILLPLYIHPSDTVLWQNVAQGGSSCIAIFNPSNGPQSGKDIIYAGDGDDLLYGLEDNDKLYGDGGDDILYGGAGNDKLYGGEGSDLLSGGSGKNILVGGEGDDTYIIDIPRDTITEKAHAGNDTVETSLESFSIARYLNIENLISTSDAGAALVGNKYTNSITGGIGDDTLEGGMGNDILSGGEGVDTFIFKSTPNAQSNIDTILDFSVGIDTISLSASVFRSLKKGWGEDHFILGTQALDTNDTILYDPFSGALYYDRDGSGKAVAIEIAVLGIGLHPLLSFNDISLI